MQKNAGAVLACIIILAVLGVLFVVPASPLSKFRPWRLGLDLVGGSHLVYQVDLSQVPDTEQELVLGGLRDVIERRVNLFGVGEPQVFVAKSGDETRLIVELAGIRDVSEAIKQIGETPFLDFREVDYDVPPGAENATSSTDIPIEDVRFIPTELNGRHITGAVIDASQGLREPQVLVNFSDEGAALFETITERNIDKPLAIFLDNALISAPVVQEKIAGGSAVISGGFTFDEAKQLVERFNAGALPAPITLINQQTVSPTLGLNSLLAAVIGGVAGTILVVVFMLLYYGFFGIFASLALVIYIIVTLSVFKVVPVTLTLAGLAGFILTIGMAVDANILIFERTREEMARGLSKKSAIEEGFRRAWPSVRDSNMSTMITAVILYFFTSSFIQGFALTLFLGVLVSMFSAITVTRTMMRVMVRESVEKSAGAVTKA